MRPHFRSRYRGESGGTGSTAGPKLVAAGGATGADGNLVATLRAQPPKDEKVSAHFKRVFDARPVRAPRQVVDRLFTGVARLDQPSGVSIICLTVRRGQDEGRRIRSDGHRAALPDSDPCGGHGADCVAVGLEPHSQQQLGVLTDDKFRRVGRTRWPHRWPDKWHYGADRASFRAGHRLRVNGKKPSALFILQHLPGGGVGNLDGGLAPAPTAVVLKRQDEMPAFRNGSQKRRISVCE